MTVGSAPVPVAPLPAERQHLSPAVPPLGSLVPKTIGIVASLESSPLPVPLVIRLTGTNEAEAVRILTQAGFSALTDMDEAVRQAVARAAA